MKIKGKILVMVMVASLVVPGSVYAGSKTATLKADYATATATLSTKFGFAFFKKRDYATASTEITKRDKNSPINYRVAVRLETWEDSDKCTRYTYGIGKNSVTKKASASDVCQFASRHSIDDSKNAKELEARSFYYAE